MRRDNRSVVSIGIVVSRVGEESVMSWMAPARRAAKAALRAREARWHRPPVVQTDERPGSTTVYYLTPDVVNPSGGVRVIYRHVDTLNALGIPAVVLHTKSGYRCGWFANTTRVAGVADVKLRPSDILVVPEYYGPGIDRVPNAPL